MSAESESNDRSGGLTTWSGLSNFNNIQPGDGYLACTSIATGKHAVIDAAAIVQVERLVFGIRFKVPTDDGFEVFEVSGEPRILEANLNLARILASSRRRKPEQLGLLEKEKAEDQSALPNPKPDAE